MSSSTSNTGSTGFGITLHHEGQNDQNSIAPSPSGGTGQPTKHTADQSNDQQGTINEDDVRNNKP